NGAGPPSLPSNQVIPTTVPNAPRTPTVLAQNTRIRVSFAKTATGGLPITGYHVRCTSSNGGTARSNYGHGSPITVGSLTNGKTSACRVRPSNANGSRAASPASPRVIPFTRGSRLFSGDGGVFTFGETRYFGSAKGKTSSLFIAMVATPDNNGYWLAAQNGA